jgi:enoyl-CoA hydratase
MSQIKLRIEMLELQIKNHVAYLALNHPGRGNSFGIEEADALSQALKTKGLMGLVLTGSGHRFFCTGGNLSQQAKARSAKVALSQQLHIRKALAALDQVPFPTVALVNGDCFGGGTELLSCFDHVVTAPHCLFGFWQRRLGLSYGWGGGQRLLRRVKDQALRQRTLTTQLFSAFEALKIGLVDDISDPNDFDRRAGAWLESARAFSSYEVLKSWDVSKEAKVFNALWMNETHKAALKKHHGS